MAQKVSIDEMANTINKYLTDYHKLLTDDLKSSVQKTAKTVKSEIKENAPKRTGKYAKSWSAKKVKETANTLELVVHSKNRYQIAHLLEKGHAKKGGGRVEARPHIAPAEEKAIKELEADIKRSIVNG